MFKNNATRINLICIGSAKYLLFGKCLKKAAEYFLKFLFLFESTILPVNNGKQFHSVAYMISPIFKHIIDCVQLYFTYGFTNIVLKSVNCLWLVGITVIFDVNSQIIVQQCQIATPSRANDISSAADNTIFKNRAQNIE